jgi:hypothetical protein
MQDAAAWKVRVPIIALVGCYRNGIASCGRDQTRRYGHKTAHDSQLDKPSDGTLLTVLSRTPSTSLYQTCAKIQRDDLEGRSRAKIAVESTTHTASELIYRCSQREGAANAQLPPRFGPKEFGEAASRFPAIGETCLRLVQMRRLVLQVGPGGRLGPDAPLRWQSG